MVSSLLLPCPFKPMDLRGYDYTHGSFLTLLTLHTCVELAGHNEHAPGVLVLTEKCEDGVEGRSLTPGFQNE